MLSLKSILKPSNGRAPTVAQIKDAIERLDIDAAFARIEIENLDQAKSTLLIEDDTLALDELARKRAVQERTVEKARLAFPMLQERLDAALAAERQAQFLKGRDDIWKKTEEVIGLIRQARESMKRLAEVRDRVMSAGFSADVYAIPVPPTLVNLTEPDDGSQIERFDQLFKLYRDTARDTPVVPISQTSCGPKFGHASPPAAPAPTPRKLSTAPAPLPADAASPPTPQRELFNEEAGEGERRVKIMRDGYETPDGRQCRNGDVVALPAHVAHKVVERGAGEFAEGRQ